jgi:DNA-binding response OmpR family regulator
MTTAEAHPTSPTVNPILPDEIIRPLVLVVTNDDSHQPQQLAQYLTEVGYEIAVVSETATMMTELKARRPYAVVIDRKIGSTGEWQGGTGPSAQHSDSDFSDTLIQHKCRSRIPIGIPQVIFGGDEKGGLVFSLLGEKGGIPGRGRSRLVDAIRGADETTGKELKTILIIDDETSVLELLTKTLLQEGFRVLRASHGRTGVEFATNFLPEVIVLDFNMPGFNGIQVVEQLRAHPRTKNIPILIHTGTVLNDEVRQRLAGQVQAITSKTEGGNLVAHLERLSALSEGADGTEATL